MKKHSEWSAWKMDEEEVRVQVNCSILAKAFAKEKAYVWLDMEWLEIT